MTPGHPIRRVWLLVIVAVVLIITALFAQRPVQAPPLSSTQDLEALFRATALPQPQTNCRVEAYNAKGGLLAKPQLICTVRGKEVKRLLPDLTGGKTANRRAYEIVARPDEDLVLLVSGETSVESMDDGIVSPDFWIYSFATWKTKPFTAASELGDIYGWQYMAVSPDGTLATWVPVVRAQEPRILYLIDARAETVRPVATVGERETLDPHLFSRVGWKDARTVVYLVSTMDGVPKEFREITVR